MRKQKIVNFMTHPSKGRYFLGTKSKIDGLLNLSSLLLGIDQISGVCSNDDQSMPKGLRKL